MKTMFLVLAVLSILWQDPRPEATAAPIPQKESVDAEAPGHTSTAEEVSFAGVDDFELRGTILRPADEADAPRPGILLIPGSGPTDRNGNQPPLLRTDLLKQIAEHLAGEGVVTFRFDKRACAVYAEQWPKESTEAMNEFFAWDHFVSDAEAALAHFRGDPGVDPDHVMILGHSEGGLIALCVADRQREAGTPVPGLILAGTAGRTLDVVVREQVERMLSLGGLVADRKAAMLEQVDAAVEAVKRDGRVPDDVMPGLRSLFNPTAASVLQAYFTIDPLELVRAFEGPVLVLNGEHDNQISAVRDARRLQIALDERPARRAGYEIVIVPKASHNFKHAETLLSVSFVGPVVPEFLNAISRWVRQELLPVEDDLGAGSP